MDFSAMKNPITDDPEQYLNHATLFAKPVHVPANAVVNSSPIAHPNPKKTWKTYVDAVCVNHLSLAINDTTPPEFALA